ncbi:MAG: GNAT family acetyltransferase [Caulobacteraceae bacterium]
MIEIGEIGDHEIDAVIALWRACGLTRPWNDPGLDVADARAAPNATILVGRIDTVPVASIMVGYDGHRGWVYYLAVDPARRRTGSGRRMMDAAARWLSARGARKLQLMVRETNGEALGFYRRLGFDRQPTVVLGRWLGDATSGLKSTNDVATDGTAAFPKVHGSDTSGP